LHGNSHFKTTVLRFGGLIGEDRFGFSRSRNLENPDAPINLIHQTDCIGIILKIIEKILGEKPIMQQLSAPFTQNVLYPKALELNLVPPKFNHDKPSVGKTILGINW
jgi:hypothetical protein